MFILPLIIVPSVNLQDNVISTNDNVEENQAVHLQNIPRVEIETNSTESVNDDNDIEIKFRQSLDRGNKVPKREINRTEPEVNHNNDSLNKSIQVSDTNEVDLNNLVTDLATTKEKATNDTLIFNHGNSIFSENLYKTEFEPFKLTISTNDDFTVRQYSDDGWKNFTQISNAKVNQSLSKNLNSLVTGQNSTEGTYTAPLYNNTMIDQVSITTNSYTNLESPPTQHDRWKLFSQLKRDSLKPSGFRPLAGLYYDGVLHSSLVKRPGFIPYY